MLCIGRRPYAIDDLRKEYRESLEKYSRVLPLDEAAWRSFAARIAYERLDFTDAEGFDALAATLEDIDAKGHGRQPPLLPRDPAVGIRRDRRPARSRRARSRAARGGWRRIVIEKPFGHDLPSAIRLNREVGKVFRESQVYRIDHYLGKETVRNLLVFRFGNGIFEPIWNRRHIDHIQITVAESIGVGIAARSTRRQARAATSSRTTSSS